MAKLYTNRMRLTMDDISLCLRRHINDVDDDVRGALSMCIDKLKRIERVREELRASEPEINPDRHNTLIKRRKIKRGRADGYPA